MFPTWHTRAARRLQRSCGNGNKTYGSEAEPDPSPVAASQQHSLFSGVVGAKETGLLGRVSTVFCISIDLFFCFKRLTGPWARFDGFSTAVFFLSGVPTALCPRLHDETGYRCHHLLPACIAWPGMVGGSRHRVHRWPKVLWGQLRASRRIVHPE